MEKTFQPNLVEKKIYDNWLKSGYFHAKINKNKQPFTIIMPPPNITAKLHIGHAYDCTIQDTIIRYKRMKGYEALLLPGTDHAALATEVKVVEKLKQQGITKEQLGREKFLEVMQDWYKEYGGEILNQFKALGLSCDWDRLAFTLDEKRSQSVRQAFVHLYNKGLIYEGNRITNWCINCKTALSDIEVEYEAHNGNIWYIQYPIAGTDKHITVATTRPETMFGDVAVAVNPDDERYKDLVGKNLILPIVNKEIPVIADEYVDKEFGTGMVKITPAHDPNDFEVGARHNLPVISVMNEDGTMNSFAGKYEGLDRLECRKQLVADLKKEGYLEKIEKHNNNVGHCCRCHTMVEPFVTKQWYVAMKELAKPAIDVIKTGEIKFVPKRFENLYLSWMENINDWCISRQIWSGHRIPVFKCDDCGHNNVSIKDPTKCEKCGSTHLTQDPDSLDTWFSSALWPFSTLGWPDDSEDMKYFYPTSLMVTAYDIIFFWVARMIFSGLEYTKQVPFREILMHGLIRDSQGRKMSKSLGNGIDPVEVIEKYGTDTLRLSLLIGTAIGQDGKYGDEKIENARNFINKLWNASRFVLENIKTFDYKTKDIKDVNLTVVDKWILSELNSTIASVTKSFEKYDISVVVSTLYEFVWNKFCDWYIETCKPRLYGEDKDKNDVCVVLLYVLENILKLLHPLIPFVTETIYQELPHHGKSIMVEKYPESKSLSYKKESATMDAVMTLVKSVRNIRAKMNVADNIKPKMYIEVLDKGSDILSTLPIICRLASGKDISVIDDASVLGDDVVTVVSDIAKLYIKSDDMVDREKELARLNNELKKVEAELTRANSMLNNAGFVAKAPKQLIDAEKEKVIKFTELMNTITASISKLQK